MLIEIELLLLLLIKQFPVNILHIFNSSVYTEFQLNL